MRVIKCLSLCVLGFAMLASGISQASAAQQANAATTESAAATRKPSPPVADPAAPRKLSLADFAWLSGRWQGLWGPRVVDQEWTPPRAGSMLGIYRIIEADQVLVIEILELSESPDGIEYRIRHFTPGLAPWEKTDDPTLLKLASIDPKRIVFENPADGQPKHVILDRGDEDTFISRAEIAPQAGEPQVVSITFHRQKPPVKKPEKR